MTIDRVYLPSWGVGEMLTSAQMNAIDTALTYALDRRISQTDVLASAVTVASGGRFITKQATGADANTTYQATGPNRKVKILPNLSADREYTLGSTGAVEGETIIVHAHPSATSFNVAVKNHDGATLITLGHAVSADAPWAEFYFNGSDWTIERSPQGPRLRREEFLSNSTWVCPSGVYFVDVEGCGAGGGGRTSGSDSSGNAGQNEWGLGGPGGGAALFGRQTAKVVPGTTYYIMIGTGAANAAGSRTFFGTGPSSALVSLLGGGVGAAGRHVLTGVAALVYGGPSTAGLKFYDDEGIKGTSLDLPPETLTGEGWGGYGVNRVAQSIDSTFHRGSHQRVGGYTGGVGGGAGTDDGNYRGGGGGGGGGAGPYGDGGAGGAGGNGNSAGVGNNGTAGTAGAANTGAGGGGGGAAGWGLNTGALDGAGAAGGTGRLYLVYTR